MMLECGHVISKDSLSKLIRNAGCVGISFIQHDFIDLHNLGGPNAHIALRKPFTGKA